MSCENVIICLYNPIIDPPPMPGPCNNYSGCMSCLYALEKPKENSNVT